MAARKSNFKLTHYPISGRSFLAAASTLRASNASATTPAGALFPEFLDAALRGGHSDNIVACGYQSSNQWKSNGTSASRDKHLYFFLPCTLGLESVRALEPGPDLEDEAKQPRDITQNELKIGDSASTSPDRRARVAPRRGHRAPGRSRP